MRTIVCMLGVLAISASAMGQGLDFQEDYDSHVAGQAPGAPWFNVFPPGPPDPLWVVGSGTGKQRSTPHSLIANNAGFNGADKGSSALLDGGALWGGSDACPLALDYWTYDGSAKQGKEADFYVELSLGDVRAPPMPNKLGDQVPPAEPIPVLAYCKPWNTKDGNKKKMFYFDGKIWKAAGFRSSGWRHVEMAVKSDTVHLKCGTGGNYPNIDREYTGMFDTISIYTINYKKGKWTSIDDVSVAGGYTILTPALDILPDDDPNVFVVNKKNNKSKGRLPMAILGSEDFSVADIDADSISIADAVFPLKTPSIEDVNLDGIDDLAIHVSRRDLIDAMGLDLLDAGTEVEVTVNAGLLAGCDLVAATDVIILQATGD